LLPDPRLPGGARRLRIGDAERERVAEALEQHFHAGRLSADELEARVQRALRARTVGELRDLLADLPHPPAPAARAGRREPGRLVRGVKGAVRLAVAVLATLLVIGILVGDDDDEDPAAPDPPATSGPSAQPEQEQERVTTLRLGQEGRDNGTTFVVTRFAPERSIPFADPEQGRLSAGEGRVLLTATVRVSATEASSSSAFCGSGGAQLITDDLEARELVPRLYELAGNEGMCQPVSAGTTSTYRLVFQAPRDTRAEAVDVWNAASDQDVLGNSRLRFRR
jgi:hypothetical protein